MMSVETYQKCNSCGNIVADSEVKFWGECEEKESGVTCIHHRPCPHCGKEDLGEAFYDKELTQTWQPKAMFTNYGYMIPSNSPITAPVIIFDTSKK